MSNLIDTNSLPILTETVNRNSTFNAEVNTAQSEHLALGPAVLAVPAIISLSTRYAPVVIDLATKAGSAVMQYFPAVAVGAVTLKSCSSEEKPLTQKQMDEKDFYDNLESASKGVDKLDWSKVDTTKNDPDAGLDD